MKGGINAMVMAIKSIVSSEIELKGDLMFESVVDEEHAGCNGTLTNRIRAFLQFTKRMKILFPYSCQNCRQMSSVTRFQ